MSAATSAINTPERPGCVIALAVAAAATVFTGTIGARDAAGKLVPASDTAGLRVLGRVEDDGSAGNTVNVRRGVFLWANSATNALSPASLGKLCYVEDDNTVASTSASRIVAGRVIDVSNDGVWVDTTDIPFAALPADTTTNGAAAGAADLVALKTESEAVSDTLRATIAAIAS